ncbi:type VII secretion protein EccB [Streptomyces sp. NPDC048629]|uniref:type VII secretion protein EccB n=1 Tax=Streptomyces sp. NPDC048629 TaxID=3154824 RepID=UPI00343D3D8F
MHTRRDQVQAHLFTLSRVTAGLIRAEPDAAETPMRRFTLGTVMGLAVGVLVLGGLVGFGFISPGITNSFKKQGTIVVEKETGTRYVFLDGALHPVLNHASAVLISGRPPGRSRGGLLGGQNTVQTVSSKSLKQVPKGPPIGIVGAPDSLPDPKQLDRSAWAVCTTTSKQADGSDIKRVTAYLGGSVRGLTELGDQRTMLVKGDDGTYLAWLDRKLKLGGPAALVGLGYSNVRSFPVADAWLNALPSGADLRAVAVPGRGGAGIPLGGQATRVGQLFRTAGGESYLMMPDGLAPLTETEAALVLADPATQAAYPGGQVLPLDIGTAAVAAAPRSNRTRASGLPTVLPQAVDNTGTGDRVPCFKVTPGKGPGGTAAIRVASRPAGPEDGTAAPGVPRAPGAAGALTADRVVIAPGSGMLVREEAPAGDAAPRLYLITDVGQKFPLATPDVAKKLGYDDTKAAPLPASVLALVPSGPVLDEAAAKTPLAAN